MPPFEPAYLAASRDGSLKEKRDRARRRLRRCRLCPRRCGANRLAGETGFCRTGDRARIASFDAHFGEEEPLVGRGGSGTIFLSHCNLLCVFCQNFEISHDGWGRAFDDRRLADAMLALQRAGCHNINFVTPSHVVPQILAALVPAVAGGLRLPLIYNTGGYDRVETLRMLEGVFDVYMPDFKFWDADVADAACTAPDYPEVARRALREMHRQVGDLRIDGDGLARRGLLVRHLVMPGGRSGTRQVMAFLAEEISRDTYVNVMGQYRPCGRAGDVAGLERALAPETWREALAAARRAGLRRLDRPRRVFRFR